jgi:hypothetical protein
MYANVFQFGFVKSRNYLNVFLEGKMKEIEKRIQQQCQREERNFLLDTIRKEAIYFAKEDKESMRRLITRVNLLHGSLSEAGKKLATEIIDKITEDVNSI